ncbi:hypothetical protein J6590_097096, partial [Homalodisca vitripennis]
DDMRGNSPGAVLTTHTYTLSRSLKILSQIRSQVQERNSCLLLLSHHKWSQTSVSRIFLLCWKTGLHDEEEIPIVEFCSAIPFAAMSARFLIVHFGCAIGDYTVNISAPFLPGYSFHHENLLVIQHFCSGISPIIDARFEHSTQPKREAKSPITYTIDALETSNDSVNLTFFSTGNSTKGRDFKAQLYTGTTSRNYVITAALPVL